MTGGGGGAPDRGDAAAHRRHPSAGAARLVPRAPDPLGKMALYSGVGPERPFGTFLVDCSACRRETAVRPADLLRAALPVSLHLPVVRRYPSYMRCPSCGRRAWLRVSWTLS
ncbi:MAG TPA: hypothetical protein VEO00_13245 [Actinomycetota bacterium]|nr:hypothetical protein [Actinomycetota bacterium]